MLVPQIWGGMTAWPAPTPPPTALELGHEFLGSIADHRYAHFHPSLGGLGNGMSYGQLKRFLKRFLAPIYRPVFHKA